MPPNIEPIDESELHNVNDIDRTRLDGLETKLDAISRDVARLTNAVIGDEQAGNYGIVSRIIKLEGRVESLEKDMDAVRANHNKIFVWSAAIAFMVGTIWQAGRLLFDIMTR